MKRVTYNDTHDSGLDTFAAACDDERGDQAFRAWGSRRVTVASARPGSSTSDFHQPGAVNVRALRTTSRLPRTAHPVDAVFREPQRASGSWTFIRPFHQQYEYYKTYGNAGAHALSSHHHNFPGGDVPRPTRIYSAEPQCRVTTVRMNRPKRYNTTSTMTTRAYPSPLYVERFH